MPVFNYLHWKWLLLLLLIFCLSRSQAQQSVTPYQLKIDSLPANGFTLDKGWKWHAGDNFEWAKADFDDSLWDTLNPNQDIASLNQLPQQGIGWLRIHLLVAPHQRGQAINLYVYQAGATEIFLDGQLAFRYGKINTIKRLEKGVIPRYLPELRLSHDSILVVAVRYAFSRERWTQMPKPFFQIRLRSPKDAQAAIAFSKKEVLIQAILLGVFLISGILQLLLYVTSTAWRTNLYFGIFLLVQSLIHYFILLQREPALIPDSLTITNQILFSEDLFHILFYLFSTISGLFYLLGVYEYYNQAKGIVFWVVMAISLTSLPTFLFAPLRYFSFFYLIAEYILPFIIPYTDILRVGIIAIRRQKLGAKLFTIAHALLLMVFVLLALAEFFPSINFLSSNVNWFFLLSFLSVAVTISLILSQERSATNKLLQKQLLNLEVLSQKNLAQEQEKQQILANQNERLEQQVEIRTAELKASQNQLIQKEKLASLGELTAGIAHEIQNPLNFVNNFSEVSSELIEEMNQEIERGDMDEVKAISGDLKQNLEKINHHGQRASSIVKGMLEHSRISTGKRTPTDLNQLADEYLRLSYHGMKAKNRDFQSDYELLADLNLPLVNIVPQEIGRVLLNLLNNAFYAVKDVQSPKVIVSTSHRDKQVIIKVQDNGTGISESVKAKIFQPFFTTKPTGEGTGLGLSLSYDIVTKGHGGTLMVESLEGLGSEFILTLPVV